MLDRASFMGDKHEKVNKQKVPEMWEPEEFLKGDSCNSSEETESQGEPFLSVEQVRGSGELSHTVSYRVLCDCVGYCSKHTESPGREKGLEL